VIIGSRMGGPLLSLTIVGTVIGTTLSAKPQSTLGPKAGDVTKSRRGAALFNGREDLQGKLDGMSITLPPETLRCKNCHSGPGLAAVSNSSAPALTASTLMTAQSRRNGPPSSYNPQTFCKLLRTGIDPAYVVVSRDMPRYSIDEAQCESLWSYLIGTNH